MSSDPDGLKNTTDGEPRKASLHDLPLLIRFRKRPLCNHPTPMRVRRNYLTGEIVMYDAKEFPNFHVVDLCDRPRLPLSRKDLELDRHLFKPVPMMYRTWLYHGLFSNTKLLSSAEAKETDFVLKKALSFFCLDVKTMKDNRWSPLIVYAFLMFISSLTLSDILVLATLAVSFILATIGYLCNTPYDYWKDRFYSLPFRIAYIILVISIFPRSRIIEAIGSVMLLIGALLEIYFGDYLLISLYRYHCNYSFVKNLGHRVYVVRRNRGDDIPRDFGHGGHIHEDALNLDEIWTVQNLLIAEINGLLVELRPMEPQDWTDAFEDSIEKKSPLLYVGIGLSRYTGPEIADADEVPGWANKAAKGRPAKRDTESMFELARFRVQNGFKSHQNNDDDLAVVDL